MSESKMSKETIESYEDLAKENKEKLKEIQENAIPPIISEKVQKKTAKAVRAILAGGMVVPLPFLLAACKKASVVEEEVEEKREGGKGEVIISSEDKGTSEKIEWEKTIIPSIEGLRFDKGTFYFLEGNDYGEKAGEKAGVFIKEAIEINGKMENSIGLDPKIIEFKEKEIFKETKERLLPIFIDLTTAKDVKVQELNAAGTEINKKVLAFNVSVGTEFLAPLSGGWGMFKPFPNIEDKQFFTNWDVGVEGESGKLEIYFRDAEILAEMKEEAQVINPKDGRMQTLMGTKVKLGDPLGKITSNIPLENFSKSDWGDHQIVTFLENKDRIMEVGSGTSACKVFIFNQ